MAEESNTGIPSNLIASGGENINPNADILFALDAPVADLPRSPKVDDSPRQRAGLAKAEEKMEAEDDEGEDEKDRATGRIEAQDDDSEEDSEEDSDEEKDEEDPEETKKETKKEEKPETPKRKKNFIIKVGDEKLKIKPDASVIVKEGGEYKEVSLVDLTESYSSSQANLKNFNQLKKDREALEREKGSYKQQAEAEKRHLSSQLEAFGTQLQRLAGAAKQGNSLQVLAELFEAVGEDPLPVIRSMRKSLVESAREYLQLSEVQRQHLDAVEEAEYYKTREAKLRQAQEKERQLRQQSEVLASTAKKYGIPDLQTFQAFAQKLEESKRAGRFSGEINPTTVGQFYEAYNRGMFIISAVEEVDKSLLQDEKVMGDLTRMVQSLDPSKEELIEVLKEISKKSASQDNGKGETKGKKLSFSSKPSKSTGSSDKKATRRDDLFL